MPFVSAHSSCAHILQTEHSIHFSLGLLFSQLSRHTKQKYSSSLSELSFCFLVDFFFKLVLVCCFSFFDFGCTFVCFAVFRDKVLRFNLLSCSFLNASFSGVSVRIQGFLRFLFPDEILLAGAFGWGFTDSGENPFSVP